MIYLLAGAGGYRQFYERQTTLETGDEGDCCYVWSGLGRSTRGELESWAGSVRVHAGGRREKRERGEGEEEAVDYLEQREAR